MSDERRKINILHCSSKERNCGEIC